jgi:hypothetical protein
MKENFTNDKKQNINKKSEVDKETESFMAYMDEKEREEAELETCFPDIEEEEETVLPFECYDPDTGEYDEKRATEYFNRTKTIEKKKITIDKDDNITIEKTTERAVTKKNGSGEKSDKNGDKKERIIIEGQKDLEGHDAIWNKITEGEKEIGILCEQIREQFKKHLLIKDDNIIDVPYATVVTHMFPGDTLWTACVGQSSGGKTEILRSIGEQRTGFVYPVSRITQGGILSGAKGEVGMAYDANNKIVLIKDLVTAITSKNSETVFSQLREMFDGSINITSGLGEEDNKKTSKGKSGIKVTLIAGVTPDVLSGDTIFKSALGERFIYYMFPKFEIGDIKELTKRRTSGSSDDGKRRIINALADKLLNKIFELRKMHFARDTDIESFIDDDYFEWLYQLSAFTAYLRRTVGWSWNKYNIDTIGTEEAPHRLQKELTRISVGLKIVKMKYSVNDDEVKNVIMKICTDSIPYRRFAGIRIFMSLKKIMDKTNVKGIVVKERLMLEFGFSKSTAKTVISELVEMNILRVSGENNENGDFTVLELNGDFVKDYGQILEDVIVYADKYKSLKIYNR